MKRESVDWEANLFAKSTNMSRIGKKPVLLPKDVVVTIGDAQLLVKGPKGELTLPNHPQVRYEQVEDEKKGPILNVTVVDESSDKAIWGTMRSHANNMVHGVTAGWQKTLELNGVGFKMNVAGKNLKLSLGFSHDIDYAIPEGINADIQGNKLTIAGIDKELVGKVASEIRSLKKPEPYKGKGFKYDDEVIRRKAGKAAKSE
jgi:large subunit ribosomal protein L6